MTKYLIVMADGRSGRGTRGLNLYRFLKTWHCGAVKIVSPSALRRDTHACEVLFVGLPTPLTKDDLARVRYRELVVFDYEDQATLLVEGPNAYLAGLTDRYFKVWTEPGWPTTWKFGALPIRRQARLPIYLRWLAFKAMFGAQPPEREYDVTFLGNPTGQLANSQRVQWMQQIRDTDEEFSFWGGIVASTETQSRLAAAGVDVTPLLYEGGRVPYNAFFELMRRSRVVLTPMGNAPWSYRHYEAIYAGAIPVSCDLRNVTTLIPLPLKGMVQVPEGVPLIPAIADGLRMANRPDVIASNLEFLNQYLHFGDYSRHKPELLHRFERQL